MITGLIGDDRVRSVPVPDRAPQPDDPRRHIAGRAASASGRIGERELVSQLAAGGGALSRVFGRLTRGVLAPWQMYPSVSCSGSGFDTATEIAVLFLAAGAAWSRLPIYAALCLPILFAAGMSMLDTLDGCFMTCAYGWTFTSPVRKVYFNITITALFGRSWRSRSERSSSCR